MTRALLIALAAVAIVASPALADGGRGLGGPGHGRPGHGGFAHGGHGHGDRLRSSLPTRVFPQHHHRHFNGQRFFPYGGGYGVYAPPVIGYGTYAYSTPTYAVPEYVPPSPTYYPPSRSYAPAPMQTVIEFPNGRYVLQGDGITTAYRWVWVPNPPPSPPAEESAAAPPPPAPPAEREPVRSLDFYRWTDAEGVTHFSDRLDLVPEAYRSKVTRSRT